MATNAPELPPPLDLWPTEIAAAPPLDHEQRCAIVEAAHMRLGDPAHRENIRELIAHVEADTRPFVRAADGAYVLANLPSTTADRNGLDGVSRAIGELAERIRRLPTLVALEVVPHFHDSVCAGLPSGGLQRSPGLDSLELTLRSLEQACSRTADLGSEEEGRPRTGVSIARYIAGRLARTFYRFCPRWPRSDAPAFVRDVLLALRLGRRYGEISERQVVRWIRTFDKNPTRARDDAADVLALLRDYWGCARAVRGFMLPSTEEADSTTALLDELVREVRAASVT